MALFYIAVPPAVEDVTITVSIKTVCPTKTLTTKSNEYGKEATTVAIPFNSEKDDHKRSLKSSSPKATIASTTTHYASQTLPLKMSNSEAEPETRKLPTAFYVTSKHNLRQTASTSIAASKVSDENNTALTTSFTVTVHANDSESATQSLRTTTGEISTISTSSAAALTSAATLTTTRTISTTATTDLLSLKSPISTGQNCTLNVSATVSWKHTGGIRDDTLVLCHGGNTSFRVHTDSPHVTSVTLRDLIPGEKYQCRVLTMSGNVSSVSQSICTTIGELCNAFN